MRVKEKKKNDLLTTILLVVFAIIFIFAASQLYSIYNGYRQGAKTYDEVSEIAITVPEVTYTDDEEVEIPYEYYYVDFDALFAQNSDIVAWIRFDAPEVINYPVAQTDDNSTYLTTTFLGEYNSVGTLFVDMDNSSDFTDANTVIYGHNMKNGSMFGDLSEYINEAFYTENPYFYVYTPDGRASKYQIVAVENISVYDSYRYSKTFDSSSEFQSYIDALYKTSFYDTGTLLNTNSKIITLSTCTSSDDERFIVQGVRVDFTDMVQVDTLSEEDLEEEKSATPLVIEFE
ncbi:MAG: class B sortase [Eubacteriales bacterium]